MSFTVVGAHYPMLGRQIFYCVMFLFCALAVGQEKGGPLKAANAENGESGLTPMPVSFTKVLDLPVSEAFHVFNYGGESQYAALWLSQDMARAPLIVFVHGGCWLADYSAPHGFPLAQALAEDGFAVLAPEYRRVGESGGGWPAAGEDLFRAMEYLAVLDIEQIDLSRSVLVGHSAGGHLALWAAAQDPRELPLGLQLLGAIGLAPITDLVAYAAGDNSCQKVTVPFMGATPEEQPQRYAQASPAMLPLRVPTVLLRGDRDDIVGQEQLDAMSGARSIVLAGAGHFDWIHPHTVAYQRLLTELRALTGGAAEEEASK